MANTDLTSLEQQIMRDYGKYISVPIPPAPVYKPTGNMADYVFANNQRVRQPAIPTTLPYNVARVGDTVQLNANSDLFKKYLPLLTAEKNNVTSQQILNALQPPSNPLSGIDYLRTRNNTQPSLNMFGIRAAQPNMAKFRPTVQTNTLEQAMQMYADRNKMKLEDLQKQIEATRAARAQIEAATPKTIEDVNRTMYAQPNDMAALEKKYATGGYVEGDLVEAPDYTNVPTQQVEPSGGGYVAPVMRSANPELNALLSSYDTGVDYTADLSQAREQRKASERAFNESMEKLVAGSGEGPSKAELYWRLAAAFGTPGKTGSFGESLVNATGQMAEHSKEQRLAQQAKRKLEAEIGLKRQEMALESAKDTEKTLLGLQSEANKDRREMLKATIKEYIDSGKPQSEAGRIAKDKGLKVGTPEYQNEVDKQANLLIEKQLGAIRAQLLTGQATLANIGMQQRKEEREAVKLEPDERKAIRDDEDAIYASKSAMKNIDEAMSVADMAFSNTIADKATYRKLKQTNPTDPRVVATEQLENLLGTNTLSSLKATFGGAPTEGERNALKELQGLAGASPASRKKILERAKKALQEGAEHRSMRINKIETGGYRKKPAADKE